MAKKRIMLLGPPGSGKGTQSERITKAYDIPVVATGDIFRKNISEGTPLGLKAKSYLEAGHLVPDELVIELIKERLLAPDTQNGYLLDGFPRTTPQAEMLTEFLAGRGVRLDAVFYIKVPKDVLVSRIAGRWICPVCNKVYHVTARPPKVAGQCDIEGATLIQRGDDTAEMAEHRIDVYNKQTMPLVQYYIDQGLLVELDGTIGVDALEEQIEEILG
ncbi:MAG: adenylate kinase [Clostridiales Family XIII bacterium]|jgi:adenylate kinase|nr:adenylate kinase [Clostridiales Family XIII bacterium]